MKWKNAGSREHLLVTTWERWALETSKEKSVFLHTTDSLTSWITAHSKPMRSFLKRRTPLTQLVFKSLTRSQLETLSLLSIKLSSLMISLSFLLLEKFSSLLVWEKELDQGLVMDKKWLLKSLKQLCSFMNVNMSKQLIKMEKPQKIKMKSTMMTTLMTRMKMRTAVIRLQNYPASKCLIMPSLSAQWRKQRTRNWWSKRR